LYFPAPLKRRTKPLRSHSLPSIFDRAPAFALLRAKSQAMQCSTDTPTKARVN
jgi:hypothetical protein